MGDNALAYALAVSKVTDITALCYRFLPVGFQSGTHKTHLFKLLEDQQRLGRLHSNKKVHFVETLESFNTLNVLLTSDDCLIADELNFSASGLDLLFQKVRDANAYLIAIGRIYIKQFEYSVDAIYQIERDGNRFVLKRAFHHDTSRCYTINTGCFELERELDDAVILLTSR